MWGWGFQGLGGLGFIGFQFEVWVRDLGVYRVWGLLGYKA